MKHLCQCLAKSPEFSSDQWKCSPEHWRRHCETSWLYTRPYQGDFSAIPGTRWRLPFFLTSVKCPSQLFALWPFWCSPTWWYFPWRSETPETDRWWVGYDWQMESLQKQSKQECHALKTALNKTIGKLCLFQAIEPTPTITVWAMLPFMRLLHSRMRDKRSFV